MSYAKVVVLGSPITKSNFKLHNKDGRAILPYNTGGSHDKYALYEQEIAYYARSQNPDTVLTEGLIAILKVFYKYEKRHPDTANITKSIFDGIEKSGLIVNDAQIRRIVVEEYYDKENPRFELEFFGESTYSLNYSVTPRQVKEVERVYTSLKKNTTSIKPKEIVEKPTSNSNCSFCKKDINPTDCLKADGGKTLVCRACFTKLF